MVGNSPTSLGRPQQSGPARGSMPEPDSMRDTIGRDPAHGVCVTLVWTASNILKLPRLDGYHRTLRIQTVSRSIREDTGDLSQLISLINLSKLQRTLARTSQLTLSTDRDD